jgi:LppX_LprAFG lipoprotein
MSDQRRTDGASLFAAGSVAVAAVALIATFVVVMRGSGSDTASGADGAPADVVDLDDGAVADPDVDPVALMQRSAESMSAVTSVEFRLERSGAPVFIDQFEEIALDGLRGQFTVPTKAQAELTVTVSGNLPTKIGAVAIDTEVWISNPVTGDFETLPAGYDIDPSRFFDPEDGWQPLLANLRDVELVGIDDRGGDRYHVRGVADAADVRNITVDLVRDQDVPIDFWIHPTTALVTAAEFTTVIDGADADWQLDLADYGDSFTINPPENIRD